MFAGRQIHASEDDGSVNHTLIRDYGAEASRLDRFGEELRVYIESQSVDDTGGFFVW